LDVVVTLLLAVDEAIEELVACEVDRLTMVLGGMREAVDKDGNVVDLFRDVGVCGVVILWRGKGKPARWSNTD
jgi:hypothetical protein